MAIRVRLNGTPLDDFLVGLGAVENIIYGGAGNDVIIGGNLADTLVGEAGRDTIDGGNGIDQELAGLMDFNLNEVPLRIGHFGGRREREELAGPAASSDEQ